MIFDIYVTSRLYLSNPQSEETSTPKEKGLLDNLKSYFCDENGDFSSLKTGKSLLEAGFTVVLLFTGFKAIGALAKCVKKGGVFAKFLRKKPKLNSKTPKVNTQTAVQPTTATSNPPKVTSTHNNAAASQPSKTVNKPTTRNATKKVETVTVKNGQKRIIRDNEGNVLKEQFVNKAGKVTKEIRTDINGKKITTSYTYRADGGVDKTVIRYEKGAVDTSCCFVR